MRWLAFIPVLLLVCGCRLPGHFRCGPPCEPAECAPDCVPCPPPPCPPPQRISINLHREKEKPPPPTPPDEIKEQRPQQVAQEVILVPRTVYMPYAAQTPTAPMRMIGVAPLVQPCEQPGGLKKPDEIKKPAEPAPLPKPVKECTLEELQERLQSLETLLQRIEAVVPNGPAPAAVTLSSPRAVPETPTPAMIRPLTTRPEPKR